MVSLHYLRPVPGPDDTGHGLELVQPGGARKFGLSTGAALELVYDGPRRAELGLLIDESEKDCGDFDRWIARNWGWCAPYYLFSRRSRYADVDDPDGGIRRRVLAAYRDRGEAPQPPPTGPAPVRLDHRSVSATLDVGGVLAARRSVPRPRRRPFPAAELGWILHTGCARMRAALSLHTRTEDPLSLLASFGCALDVYVVCYAVDGLPSGLYRYDVLDDSLSPLSPRSTPTPATHTDTGTDTDRPPGTGPYGGAHADAGADTDTDTDADALRRRMSAILVGQPAPLSAAATVLLVADFERYQWRYRHERALRHLWLDAAHAMGYLLLSATALEKSTHISPAARDSAANACLGLSDARHQVMYCLSAG
ncbi:nitroreductase family protein [Streptomyces sp. CC224B]|uniref:nitroreductase family protein n=1 Tax=Streptomyces sp. CC224B TaxID=3044571 RepID=UPI0024A8F6B4|nr:nitroreductase family protein [Streptomyces sp. CC224B]